MAESMALTDRDTTLVVVPQFHVNAWGLPHATFMTGINMLMPDRFLQPAPLAEMIERERPSHAAAVPTIWQGLLAEVTANPRDLSSMTQVTIGGAACPPSLMEAYDRLGVRLCHAWGMTETSPLGTMAHPPAGLSAEEEWPYRVTQGRFPAGVEARLVGPGGDHLPWDGESAGELEVRGTWIAGSYFGGVGGEEIRPADKFSEDGWLKTGDVGVISPDGFLTLTDRAKDVIKSGGEWISSVDLENALMAHPEVAERRRRRRAGREVGRAPARDGRPQGGRHGGLRDAAVLPRRRGRHRQVAAAGALGGRADGAEDERRQVRQEGHPQAVRGGRVGRDAAVAASSRAAGQPGSRAAGQPGSRAAGQPGSRAAGQPGSRAAGQPGSRAAGQPDLERPRRASTEKRGRATALPRFSVRHYRR
ncbi:2-succinylbenzoate--CoA ligase [Streptomyces narbonensis]